MRRGDRVPNRAGLRYVTRPEVLPAQRAERADVADVRRRCGDLRGGVHDWRADPVRRVQDEPAVDSGRVLGE
jgi:hypothetical protein